MRKLFSLLLIVSLGIAACGGSSTDPLRQGRSLYADGCSACHGATGAGGVGPSLESVLETWPECASHMEWIAIGSEGWRDRHGATYGAPNRPLNGGMPGHGDRLTSEEIGLVAAFERVEYGGQDEAAALLECGVESPA